MFPFSQPFPYVAALGAGLVVDSTATVYTPVSNATWKIDAAGTAVGRRDTNWSATGCRFSNNSISHRNPVLGSTGFVNSNNIIPNAPAWARWGSGAQEWPDQSAL